MFNLIYVKFMYVLILDLYSLLYVFSSIISRIAVCHSGGAENVGPENAAPENGGPKLQGWKMQDRL